MNFEELERRLATAIKDYDSIKARYNIALDRITELEKEVEQLKAAKGQKIKSINICFFGEDD